VRGVAATWAALAAIAVPVAFAGPPPLTQNSVPGYGVALKVPTSWIRLDSESMKLQNVAYAVADPLATAGFHSNLNLLVTDVPAGTPIRKWLLGDSGPKYLAIGTLKTVRINGVTALEYESSRLEKAGGKRLYTLEFAFNRNGRAYLFTYTAPATGRGHFEPVFRASAATIRFVVLRAA
jgi:hypothetical protein